MNDSISFRTPGVALTFVFATMAWFPLGATACQIPVFRYALERWDPDYYRATVVHAASLGPEQQQLIRRLESARHDGEHPLNLETEVVDVTGDDDRSWKDAIPPDVPLPAVVLRYPSHVGNPQPAWVGTLNEENVERLIDSPLRRELAARLLAGQSAVWILFASGDPARDDAAYETLQQELRRAQSDLKLPDLAEIKNDEYFRPDTKVDLKLEFSVVRLAHDDESESVLRSILRHSEEGLADLSPPFAIPIYGRGRTYFALVGSGINRENIDDNCRFLIGACSCQVKAQNPGVDLPFAVAWSRAVTDSVMPSIVLPELIGLGGLSFAPEPAPPSPATAGVSPTLPGEARPTVATIPTPADAESDITTTLFHAMLGIVAGMIVMISFATLWIRQRA